MNCIILIIVILADTKCVSLLFSNVFLNGILRHFSLKSFELFSNRTRDLRNIHMKYQVQRDLNRNTWNCPKRNQMNVISVFS